MQPYQVCRFREDTSADLIDALLVAVQRSAPQASDISSLAVLGH